MLRHRLVTVLTLNDGILFRTKQFSPDYRYTSRSVAGHHSCQQGFG